jgi:predicted DNA-binding protein (MmcQ/YjbR family)
MDGNLDRLRAHCLAKENVTEEYPWGDIVWKVKGKMFAATGEKAEAVSLKSTLDKQAVLIQHPDIEVAQYVGRYGWVSVHLRSEETLDLALDLIDESYDAIAKKKR